MNTKLMIVLVGFMFCLPELNLSAAGSRRKEEVREEKSSERMSLKTKKDYSKKDYSWEKRLGKDLNLTEEQKEKLEEHKSKEDDEKNELRSSLKDKQELLRAELSQKDIDREQVNQIIEEISDIQQKQLRARTESLIRFKDVLTEEQWDLIRERKRSRDKGRSNNRDKKHYPEKRR